MKYEEITDYSFFLDRQVLDAPPKKIFREKKADEAILKQLNYDNTQPVDENGNPVKYDDFAHDFNSKKEKQRAQNRKKTGDDTRNPEAVGGNAGERHFFHLQQI